MSIFKDSFHVECYRDDEYGEVYVTVIVEVVTNSITVVRFNVTESGPREIVTGASRVEKWWGEVFCRCEDGKIVAGVKTRDDEVMSRAFDMS